MGTAPYRRGPSGSGQQECRAASGRPLTVCWVHARTGILTTLKGAGTFSPARLRVFGTCDGPGTIPGTAGARAPLAASSQMPTWPGSLNRASRLGRPHRVHAAHLCAQDNTGRHGVTQFSSRTATTSGHRQDTQHCKVLLKLPVSIPPEGISTKHCALSVLRVYTFP